MVPVARSDSCAQHQCFNDYLQLLVFTGCEFTVNTDKCSTLCALFCCTYNTAGYGKCRHINELRMKMCS